MRAKPGWGFGEGDEIVPGLGVLKRLGGGTRFEVYQAIDEHLAAIVVAKILRPDRVEDPKALRQLRREARTLRMLGHPVIVRCFGAIQQGPRPHLILEHLQGPTLGSLLKRYGPLSLEQVLPLALELCSALHYLAAEGIVHLDIKPDNVVMGAPPRLIDFSIARSIERARSLREPVGTDRTMAPEQCDPEALGGPGPAADVWALGATLYEAITAQAPFPAARSHHSTAEKYPQLTAEPALLPPRTPPALVHVISGCMNKDPAARLTPGEVAGLLEPLVAALPSRPTLRRRRPRLN